MRSGHHEHVARRELHDALSDRAVQRASDEIAAATPDDDQIGCHLACDIDQRDHRIAYRRTPLNRRVSSRRQELSRFGEEQVRIHRSTDQLGAKPCRSHLRRDGDNDDRWALDREWPTRCTPRRALSEPS